VHAERRRESDALIELALDARFAAVDRRSRALRRPPAAFASAAFARPARRLRGAAFTASLPSPHARRVVNWPLRAIAARAGSGNRRRDLLTWRPNPRPIIAMRTKSLLAVALCALPFLHACQNTAPAKSGAVEVDSTAEEYAIYKQAIEEVCQPVESTNVLNITVPNHLHDPQAEEPYKYVRDNAKMATKAALDDFWTKNQEPAELGYKLDLVHGNVYVTEAQAPKVPSYPGYVELSRIGFNPEHTQAILYCGHVWSLSGSEGRAHYLVLDKSASGWTITSKLTARFGKHEN
jgi:hypothetical protein